MYVYIYIYVYVCMSRPLKTAGTSTIAMPTTDSTLRKTEKKNLACRLQGGICMGVTVCACMHVNVSTCTYNMSPSGSTRSNSLVAWFAE